MKDENKASPNLVGDQFSQLPTAIGLSENHQSGFKQRLEFLIGATGVTAFAKKCDIPSSSMQKYLGGSVPGIDKALKIAQACQVSIQWLITGEEVELKKAVKSNPIEDEFALIPGYNIQVSCGHGAINCDQLEPSRHLAFRRKWLKYKGFNEKELAIVWAKGDSMHPTISNNDTLVVHLGRKKISDGNIYVLRNDDQLWVKRVQVTPTSWELISDNDHYDKISVPKDEQHTFEVVGQVVHIAKDID